MHKLEEVLIVAKCNVNIYIPTCEARPEGVLIVAKCNVNIRLC